MKEHPHKVAAVEAKLKVQEAFALQKQNDIKSMRRQTQMVAAAPHHNPKNESGSLSRRRVSNPAVSQANMTTIPEAISRLPCFVVRFSCIEFCSP